MKHEKLTGKVIRIFYDKGIAGEYVANFVADGGVVAGVKWRVFETGGQGN